MKSLMTTMLLASSTLALASPGNSLKPLVLQQASQPSLQRRPNMSSLPLAASTPASDASISTTALSVSGKPELFTLHNGLTIIVEEDHSAPVASVQVWCSTGSIDEDKWLGAGLSHILEHMLFKGTTTRGSGQIAKEIQDQGGYLNAYTSFDRTVFLTDIPSAGVSKALDVFSDMMMNSTLPVEEYTKEQEVIRREFAMGEDDPDRTSSKLLFSAAYHTSPFRNPIIGYREVYDQLTREDVLEYYKKRYVPNNLCFVITGDVNTAAVREQLTTIFEKYPRKALEPILIKKEPLQLGMNVERKSFPTELSRLNLAWKGPGITDPNAPAAEVLGSILGSGASSLLNQAIREKKQLAYQIGAGFYGLSTHEGLIFVSAITAPEKRDATEAAILEEVEQVTKKGVTSQELEKAKNSILADHLHTLTTANGRSSDYGSSWLVTGNPNFGREYLAAIQAVTTEDIQRVAAHFFVKSQLTVTSLDPVLSPSSKEGEKEVATSDKKITQREVKKVTLPNGLRLLVCEDHRLPLISMTGMFRGGLLAETAQDNGITDLLASTIVKGTKGRTAANIAQTIEEVGGSIGASAGNNSFAVSVGVMKPHLSLGLNLLAEVLTEATFPAEEVDHEKQSQLAAIKAEDDQMISVARRLLREKLFGDHPYARRLLGTEKSVPALTAEMVREFYQRFTVGNNGVVAIFGDINAEEVITMATVAFAKIPAGELRLESPSSPAPLTTSINVDATEKKEQAVVVKGFLTTTITSPDCPALELVDSACSDLGSRFFDRIREKQALAYYVGASSLMGLAPGAFIFYMGTDPQKLDHARSEFNDEINKVAHDGLTNEELIKAKQKVLGAEAIALQSSASLAARCTSDELMGLGFDHYLKRTQEINEVTLEKLNEVIKKYFNVPGSVEAIVAPKDALASPVSTK